MDTSNIIQIIMIVVTVLIATVIPLYLNYRKSQHDLLSLLNELYSNGLIFLRYKASGRSLFIFETKSWDEFRKNIFIMKFISKPGEYNSWFGKIENCYSFALSKKAIEESNENSVNASQIEEIRQKFFKVYKELDSLCKLKPIRVSFFSIVSDSILKSLNSSYNEQINENGK